MNSLLVHREISVHNSICYILTGVFLRGTFKFRRISRGIWIGSRSAATDRRKFRARSIQPLSILRRFTKSKSWKITRQAHRDSMLINKQRRIQQCPTCRKFFPRTCRTTLLSLIQLRNPTASVTPRWITLRSRQCSVIITLFLHRQDSTWSRIHHRNITTRNKFFPRTCRTTLLSLIQSRNPTSSITPGWITPRLRQCSVIITLFLHRQDSTWSIIHQRSIYNTQQILPSNLSYNPPISDPVQESYGQRYARMDYTPVAPMFDHHNLLPPSSGIQHGPKSTTGVLQRFHKAIYRHCPARHRAWCQRCANVLATVGVWKNLV